MRTTLLSLLIALGLPSSLALAQEGDPGPVFVDEGEDPNYIEEDDGYDPNGEYVEDDGYEDPSGEYVEEAYVDPNDPNAQVVEDTRPERPGRQLSLALDVPIFLTNAQDIRPGVGAHLRFGWELGMVVPQVKLGIATNTLSEFATDFIPITGGANRLTSLWISAGIRLQILNRSRFVPVIDAGLRLQFWNYPTYEELFFEPGVTVGGGLAIEITATFGLEIGLDAVVVFPISDAFLDYDQDGTQFFLMPHLGGTLYF